MHAAASAGASCLIAEGWDSRLRFGSLPGLRLFLVGLATCLAFEGVRAQGPTYFEGQNIAPAFEGWVDNEDGSFGIVFGYMNRNWEEILDVPIGPDNYFAISEPGGLDDLEREAYDPTVADRGQATHFLPRNNRFTFTVRVPPDFGDQELVWTLMTQGITERAYGTLHRDYKLDDIVIMNEIGAFGGGSGDREERANTAPILEVEGEEVRRTQVGEPLTLVAKVTDDGVLQPRPLEELTTPEEMLERALRRPRRGTVGRTVGLYVSWFVYRGAGEVTFDPLQVKTWQDTRPFANSPWSPSPWWRAPPEPDDGRWVTHATFHDPGTYVLRARADDGGLYDDEEVTVIVEP